MRKLLWTSLEIFGARREKSASALVALAETLGKEPGAGSAFGALYASCADADPAAFTQVWSDPTAYAWVRTAFDLVVESRGAPAGARGLAARRLYATPDAEAALAAHLDAFGRFALAVAFLDGRPLALERPLRVSLPWALPGTPLSLDGEGELELASLDGAAWVEAPVLRGHDCALRLQPQAFAALPGLELLRPVLEAGPAFHAEGAPWLAGALDVVARHVPATLAVLQRHTTLLGLKPLARGEFTNYSHSDLPGAVVLSLVREPFDLAETLVHEIHHDRIFHLEELEPIFEAPESDEVLAERHYSPWREDPRPLQGLFHAVCVHVAVARFWRDALRAEDGRGEIQAYGRSRLARVALQLAEAVPVLERHADAMTHYGHELLIELVDAATEVRRQAAALGAGPEQPALGCDEHGRIAPQRDAAGRETRVGDAVQAHRERFARPEPG